MKVKLFLSSIFIIGLLIQMNIANAEDTQEQSKTEQTWETISVMSQAAAEKTANSVKKESKKAARVVKEKSSVVAEKTAKHVKSGAKKAEKATVRGANKVSNVTAKGIKKAGEKMQSSADKTIEATDKNLTKTETKCGCKSNCRCKDNCDCKKEE